MTIILNESDWAQDMIEANDLGASPFETLRRVARYYLDNGYNAKDTRDLIEKFLVRSKPGVSAVLWMDTLNNAVSYAIKHPAINIGSVTVTQPEMKVIDKLGGAQAKRLAFTLLCLSKYIDAVNPDADGWVYFDDKDIIRMANVEKASVRRQSELYRQLRDAGIIQFSKRVDNTNVRVLLREDGYSAVKVSDFRDIGNQYMMASGSKGFAVCGNCGRIFRLPKNDTSWTRRRGPERKYCRECSERLRNLWAPADQMS